MGIRSALLSVLAGALLLTGCTSAQAPATDAAPSPLDRVAELGIDTSDAKSVIEGLDTLPVASRPTPDTLIASVRPNELVLQPGDVTLPINDTDFYLSIAPYVSQTHPCDFHSLTTCLGELQNTPVELTVTDVATGEVVVSDITATADNGFVGVWLPRDGEFDVRVIGEQGVAEQRVTTGADDPTCLTTMQLQA